MGVVFRRRGCSNAFKALVPRRTQVYLRLIARMCAPVLFSDVRERRGIIEDRMGVVKAEGQLRGLVFVLIILGPQDNVLIWWNGRGRRLGMLRKARTSKPEDEGIIKLAV